MLGILVPIPSPIDRGVGKWSRKRDDVQLASVAVGQQEVLELPGVGGIDLRSIVAVEGV